MSKKPKSVTIIRREEVVEGGHHGGAWKVAYADFVTAMMAFFLLMWLLNATTEAQKRGLADYFSPNSTLAHGTSGTGRPFGGSSPFADGPSISDRGTIQVMNANAPPVDLEDDGSDTPAYRSIHAETPGDQSAAGAATDAEQQPNGDQAGERHSGLSADGKRLAPGGAESGQALSPGAARKALEQARRQEQAELSQAAAAMQQAINSDPDLAPIARQLSIDLTPEGLRVQIKDAEGLPMFATGSAEPNERARSVLKRLTPMLIGLHEPVAISGYTDAAPFAGSGRSNWDLSADRANATRRILTEGGLSDDRIKDVTGHADRDLLLPATPEAAANRRIAILLLRTTAMRTPAAQPATTANKLPPVFAPAAGVPKADLSPGLPPGLPPESRPESPPLSAPVLAPASLPPATSTVQAAPLPAVQSPSTQPGRAAAQSAARPASGSGN